MSLTKRQAELLNILRRRLAESEVSPNYDELAAELGTVKSNVYNIMCCLKERGFVTWIPGKARSLRLVEKR